MQNINIQEENEIQKIVGLISRNYKLFIIGIVVALMIAFLVNRYSIPTYKITSSILIQERSQNDNNMTDVLNQKLFGKNQKLQNELMVLKSSSVLERTVKNLDLSVGYYRKKGFKYQDSYKQVPFKILYLRDHVQPIGTFFEITFDGVSDFEIIAKSKRVSFYNFAKNRSERDGENWTFQQKGKVGKLIETRDLSFIVELDSSRINQLQYVNKYYFDFATTAAAVSDLKDRLDFAVLDRLSTVIGISLYSSSIQKGVDVLNGLMDAYSSQNLEKKNYNADVTIDFIDKQINQISDSLQRTEQKLQTFLSSKQVVNISDKATNASVQLRELQTQKADLVTRTRYYDYVVNSLGKNDDFSNMVLPSSMGIPDQMLNSMMNELINANGQRAALLENKQEKNPLIKKLTMQIDNLKKTISENVNYTKRTTEISIDELTKRINKVEAEISNLPETQRQLGSIERKFHYNESLYNYLMEKRSEAKITKASNLPDNEIIDYAQGSGPVSPNEKVNYMFALLLGFVIPYGFLFIKGKLNTKIVSQNDIEQLTEVPVLGKILHNRHKSNNVLFEHPNSPIAESYRVLRTNLEYYVRGAHKKVIMVSSSIEGEGKSFNSLNIAMSYAQFSRRTVLVDFDLRKSTTYFDKNGESLIGLSSYLINKATLDDIIIKSPHEYLDYIPSGPIPPNPVELIGLEKTEKLLNQLKNTYDYIILDTPPLAQVTDGYLLMDYADVKVLVARYNYTIKKVFSLIMKDLHQKNVSNFCIVLNDNRIFNEQYGYGYGYNKNKE